VSSEGLHPAGDGHVLGESNINLKMAHIIISHLEPTNNFYFLSTCTLISQDSSNHLIFVLKESLLIHVQNRWHFMMCRYCPQMIKMLRRSKFVITGCFFQIDGPTGRRYSYRELLASIRNVGSALLRRGFRKGDILCIVSGNCCQFPVALQGAISIGGTVTTCNPQSTMGKYECTPSGSNVN